MENSMRHYAGIIHIGTVNMAMKIISYTSMADMEVIENVSQEVMYGEEVFKTHHVSFRSLNEICRILNGSNNCCAIMISTMYELLRRRQSAKPIICSTHWINPGAHRL